MDTKPSRNEDEYFLKLDAELIKAHRERLDAERRRIEQHRPMMCPKCGTGLRETEYHHVRIDVCPQCKGAWLDAGELQMIEHVKESRVGTFLRDLLQGLPGK